MKNIIHKLSESVANQIAAGEVVQRPSSIIKELLENSIDASSKNIKVIIKEGGKNKIMIIDDGLGMSKDYATKCFEKHSTSKLKKSDDLFKIKTMGFRGEALSSIASVCQVELSTQMENNDIGSKVIIEGSKINLRDWELSGIVEKPNNNEAPSDMGVVGRYILNSSIFDILEKTKTLSR